MKLSVIVFFLGISLSSFSQNDEFMVWTGVGVRGDIVKKTDWMLNLNTRFDDVGVATFFPQLGVEYKPKKWIKASVEYRFLVKRNKFDNYKPSSRFNLNVSGKASLKRFSFNGRIRYQYAFSSLGGTDSYDSDFDQAIRIKPSVSYDIKGSIFTPVASAEFFYNPALGLDGREFNKMRAAIGAKLEMDGPHSISFKYQIDKKFHDYTAGLRHVVSLAYEYKL